MRPKASSYWDTSWSDLFTKYGAVPKYGARPDNCYIDLAAKIGRGTEIWPNIKIDGEIEIGKNCVIESDVSIIGKIAIGDNVLIKQGARLRGEGYIRSGCVIGSRELVNPKIGRNCKIEGLVIDSEISEDCEIGRFAEINRSFLSWGVNAKHGCGIRDASIGYLTNIAVNTEILNYDGKQKRRTIIGNKVFLTGEILGGFSIGDEARIYPDSLVDNDVPAMAWFVNPNPGAMPAKPHYYRKIYPHQAWYLAGNYLKLDMPMPSGNRSEFLQKVWMKYRLQPTDAEFKEWLEKPIPHLADRTTIEALEKDWKKNMDCIFGNCAHSKPEREKSEA